MDLPPVFVIECHGGVSFMKKPLFQGLCTALVTPFLGDEINFPMVDMLIRRQIEAGARAIVLAGTTGEGSTLSTEEKLALFRRGVKAASGQCKIIAGTGSNDTRKAVELSRMAEKCGVDGLLVVTPYYNKATPQGLIAHYTAIAQATTLPVLLYNVPTRTCVDIPCSVYRELAKIPNIAGVKEASPDLVKIARIVAENGSALPVYSGNDDLTAPVMALGGQGVISVASNVAPLEMNALVTAARNGDYDLAGLMQRRLLPLTDLMFCQVNPIPVKAALGRIGYDVGPCRLPLDGLSPENEEKMERFFREGPVYS